MAQATGFPPKVLKWTPLANEAAISGKAQERTREHTSPRTAAPNPNLSAHALQMITENISVFLLVPDPSRIA